MPGDNASVVALGAGVEFPNRGPVFNESITFLSGSQFQLSEPGIYMVSWQLSVDEAGQLVLEINGSEIPATVVGRATGSSQIVSNKLITPVLQIVFCV